MNKIFEEIFSYVKDFMDNFIYPETRTDIQQVEIVDKLQNSVYTLYIRICR